MARPSSFTQEVADFICEQISEGKSLRSICNEEDMPSVTTVMRWLKSGVEFREQYARSKDDSADAHAERIHQLAEEAIENPDKANAYRVAIDAFKWTASKLKPKKYGDKLALGGDPDGVPVQVSVVDYK